MIDYPQTLPSYNFRRFEMAMRDVVGRTVSPFNLTGQTLEWSGDQWGGVVQLPRMTNDTARAWLAFLAACKGRSGTFLIGDPWGWQQRGTLSIAAQDGYVQIDEAAPSGHELATRGWTPDAVGVLLAGDTFQISGGEYARVYMVTKDVDADSNGKATINIWPKWRMDISAETPAELLTDGSVESWTGSVPDNWSVQGDGLSEGTVSPSPQAGASYARWAADGNGWIFQTVTLTPSMPYRVIAWQGKDTLGAETLAHYVHNQTQSLWLATAAHSNLAAAANGDVWVASAGGQPAALFDAALIDTWYKYEWGFIHPSTMPATDTVRFMCGHTETTGVDIYLDNMSLYGPTFDGMPLLFSNPKLVARLTGNVRGWTMANLTTYGVGFEWEEAR